MELRWSSRNEMSGTIYEDIFNFFGFWEGREYERSDIDRSFFIFNFWRKRAKQLVVFFWIYQGFERETIAVYLTFLRTRSQHFKKRDWRIYSNKGPFFPNSSEYDFFKVEYRGIFKFQKECEGFWNPRWWNIKLNSGVAKVRDLQPIPPYSHLTKECKNVVPREKYLCSFLGNNNRICWSS